MPIAAGLKVFTTCPVSALDESRTCLRRLENAARWSERAGCEGILVFSDNRQLDPWLVSRAIIGVTEELCPLVAVQPAYMHPYTVAKTLASFAFLYGRRFYLNMVAGGFANDMLALNDSTPHDERYARLVEYTKIIQGLLGSSEPMSFEGSYYKVSNLKMVPPLTAELQPGVLVSGSSEAGSKAARELDATAVEYPKPAVSYATDGERDAGRHGIRIGIIARHDRSPAWKIAHARFPANRQGQITRQLATKVSDSQWHHQLAELGGAEDGPYWLGPFQNYQAMCPYIVGSYDEVADELARYVECGYTTFILDAPPSEEDMQHIAFAFELVAERRAVA